MQPTFRERSPGPYWMTQREHREGLERSQEKTTEWNRRWGGTLDWKVYPVYRVLSDDDGVEFVHPPWNETTTGPWEYDPMGYPALPLELAKVEFWNRRAVLDFVHTWGLLYGETFEVDSRTRYGGPLWSVWWHARTVRDVLTLYDALANQDSVALADALNRIAMPTVRADFHETREGTFIAGTEFLTFSEMSGFNDEYIALGFISHAITSNIGAVTSYVGHGYGFDDYDIIPPIKRLQKSCLVDTLVEAVWWHLSNFVTQERGIAVCKECGHYFEQKHKRQEFCPPPLKKVLQAEEGNRSRAQSLCALRYHSRAYRKRPVD